MTLNENWGYAPHDHDFKSPRAVALQLAAVAKGCGNLLLNVGPDPEGQIPAESVDILEQVGRWLDRHSEAIHTNDRNDLMWYNFGPTTVNGHNLYCFLKQYWGDPLIVGGLTNKVLGASLMGTGEKLNVEQRGRQTIITGLPAEAPDFLSVVKWELDGPPDHDISRVIGGADIFPDLPK